MATQNGGRKVTILVADDREYIRNLVRARLAARDEYEVIDAADGKEALDLVRIHRPDVVLTDWLMPQVDGLELCRRVRTLNLNKYIYIILLTGKEDQQDIVAGFEAGADDYIVKPFHKAELLARVRTGARIVQEQRTLRQLNDLKNKFLGMAAHDLRNPLITIRGMSELLVSGDMGQLEATQHEFVSTIHSASQEMLTLVNDLLDVSVIESGKLHLGIRRASMQDVLEDRIRINRWHAEAKNIKLVDFLEETPETYFDANRVAQVVDNLISNAIKFSPPDANICVVMVRAEGGLGIRVSVWDEGPGISTEDQVKLYGEFQRLTARPTGGEKSTGLGLAIVKKIVEAHGGIVEVNSRLNEGTEFSFTIPVEGDSRLRPPKKGPKPKILIASGEMPVRALLGTVMSSINAEVVGMARDSEEAVAAFYRESPHLFLLDTRLPGKDGLDVLKEIMGKRPGVFIMMVASPECRTFARKGCELGAAGYILTNATIADMKASIKSTWSAYNQAKVNRHA